MKTKFDLSTIMTRAWSMFRNRIFASETFSNCLRKVWAMAKAYAANGKVCFEYGVSIVRPAPAMSMADAIAAEYAAGSNGRTYFGD